MFLLPMINMSIAAGFRAIWSYEENRNKTDTNTFLLFLTYFSENKAKQIKNKFSFLNNNQIFLLVIVFLAKQSPSWRVQLHPHTHAKDHSSCSDCLHPISTDEPARAQDSTDQSRQLLPTTWYI